MAVHINIKPETKKEIRIKLGLLTVTEAARKLGVTLERLKYQIRTGCPAPEATISDKPRVYYLTSDLPKVAEYLGIELS